MIIDLSIKLFVKILRKLNYKGKEMLDHVPQID